MLGQRLNSIASVLRSRFGGGHYFSTQRAFCGQGGSEPKMRFVQFLRKNDKRKRLGVVSEDGTNIVEISGGPCISHDMVTFLKQNISLNELKCKINEPEPESITDQFALLPPISAPEKIICVGLNYKDHCDEQNIKPPVRPMFFSKYASAIVGPTDNVIANRNTQKLDYECELAVIIGCEGKNIPRERAMDYIFGYCIAQDISARDWQKEKDLNGGQFLIGKSMDTFCPLGPSIVHKSLVADVNNLSIKTKVNNVEKQCGNTSDMIFKIDEIISSLSSFMTLRPGDIILTGTPKGVGMHRTPPEFLKPGDVIESEIQCLGTMINKVVSDC